MRNSEEVKRVEEWEKDREGAKERLGVRRDLEKGRREAITREREMREINGREN